MGDKVTLRLSSPAGGVDVIEVDADLWERFEAKAKELRVPIEELFVVALDAYLKKQGY